MGFREGRADLDKGSMGRWKRIIREPKDVSLSVVTGYNLFVVSGGVGLCLVRDSSRLRPCKPPLQPSDSETLGNETVLTFH